MKEIMKKVKSIEDSGLLIKVVTKTIENQMKKQKLDFLGMLLGTLVASLLMNMLTGKGVVKGGNGDGQAGN